MAFHSRGIVVAPRRRSDAGAEQRVMGGFEALALAGMEPDQRNIGCGTYTPGTTSCTL